MKVFLSGSAFDSVDGNKTFLRVDAQTRGMPQNRGLNTVILRPDGTHKNKASHDVYGNAAAWNTWAAWINSQSDEGDIVACASYDAIRSAPRGGQAATLLSSLSATVAFDTEGPGDWRRVRTPYALLFVAGGSSCFEEHQLHQGPNAHLRVTLNSVHLRGSAFDSSEGNNTYLKINGSSLNMSTLRGLNTVILNPKLHFKAQSNHDIYGNPDLWSQWASWVKDIATEGDIVAVASYDAVKNSPDSGAAADLLRTIGALGSSSMTVGPDWRRDRASYALLFTLGSQSSLESIERHQGPNAHVHTTLIAPALDVSHRPALKFPGTDTYLSSEIDVSESDFTVSIWFKAYDANCGIFSVDAGDRGTAGHDRHLYLQDGNIAARLWQNESIITQGTNYADGRWHRVSYVIGQSAGGQKIYVDGELVASGVKDRSDLDTQTGINIGFSNDASNEYFTGEIAEVSLWSVARGERDSKAWTERVAGNESGLQALWAFSDQAGTVVRDFAGGTKDASIHGAAQWVISEDFPGEFLLHLIPRDLEKIRDEGEKLSKIGTTLGNGFTDSPPEDIVPAPLKELISEGLMPQYDLKETLENALSLGELVLDDSLLGPYGEIADFTADLMSVFITIDNAKIDFVNGKPGMIGPPGMQTVIDADGSTKLATPEDHSLRVTGDVELFDTVGYSIQADFFHYKKQPKCSFKFTGRQPIGIGAFLPGVPLIQALKISGPTFIVCNASTLYDPSLDSGINQGFNFFGNIKIAESDDEAMQFIGGLLSVDELAIHAAVDTGAIARKIILEAAVKTEITLLDGASLKMRFTRSDVGIEISGAPPEPTVSVSQDVVLTLKYGGEDTHLVFTGGIAVQPESISGFFTMNGTGRHPDGELTGEIQNTGEWKHPFGIPGIIIRQMSLQLGGTYIAPWIDNVGVHGNLKVGDIDGSMSVLVDSNDPDQFVLAGSSDRLTMVQIMSAMLSPATFAIYQALPANKKAILNKVVGVKLDDVKINIVPSATSIGGVHFRDEGVTFMGKMSAWGWSLSAFINVDTFDGITVRGDMDPVNLYEVFKITGAQGDPSPILRLKISPNASPDIYISSKVYLLGLSMELNIETDSKGLNFLFENKWGDILTNRLTCTYGNNNFAATGLIDFNLNLTIPTEFGDIPLVDIGMSAAAIIRVGAIDGFFLSLNGDFRFYGKTITLPELKLSVAPKNFEAVFNAVVKQIRDEALSLFGPVFGTLSEWANAVKDGVIVFAGDVANVAKEVYSATRDEAVKAYRILSRGANEVAKGLKNVYRASSREVAAALKKASYAIADITDALEDAFRLGANEVAKVLKQVGYTVRQVAGAIKNAFGAATKASANALKYAGFAVDQVGSALKSAYSATANQAAEALKYAGYSINQVGNVLKNTYRASLANAAKALKHARYRVKEVGRALKRAYSTGINAIAKALKVARYGVNDVASALQSAYRASANTAAKALKAAGYAATEVGGALESAYDASAKTAAKALKQAGYAVNDVGKALKSAYSVSANTAATALKYAGFGINETGKFVKDVYNLGPDALNNALIGAGYAASQVEGFFTGLGGEFNKFFNSVEEVVNPSNW